MSESESSTSPSPGDISASSPPSSPLYNGEYIYNFGHDENDENIESSESSISFYHIPIGTNHQALLPSFHDRNKDKEEISQGELVWDASKISEEKVEKLLTKMRERKMNDVDKDRVFFLLHKCNYNLSEIESQLQPSSDNWNEIEKCLFESCMEHLKTCPNKTSLECGFMLHELLFPRQDWVGCEKLIKTKSRWEIVEYFWKWRKTKRYFEWKKNINSDLLEDSAIKLELDSKIKSQQEKKRKREVYEENLKEEDIFSNFSQSHLEDHQINSFSPVDTNQQFFSTEEDPNDFFQFLNLPENDTHICLNSNISSPSTESQKK